MAPRAATHTTAVILQALASGYRYGFDIIGVTGLPSGTVYPALRRLEENRQVRSSWENEAVAHRNQRPARKYYTLTKAGERARSEAVKRFRHIEGLVPQSSAEPHTSES
jgi:PadR family transcriptional regulator PadR